jgi:hypothetical protein
VFNGKSLEALFNLLENGVKILPKDLKQHIVKSQKDYEIMKKLAKKSVEID